MHHSSIRTTLLIVLWCAAGLWPARTLAWGDEGHAIIGLIADHYLAPRTRDRVAQLLAGDDSGLVADASIAAQAAWADRYRDSDRNGTRDHYDATRQWHYVDIELDAPDLDAACFGHPQLPPQLPASRGPASAACGRSA